MRSGIRYLSFVLAAVFCVVLFAGSAAADVTKVRNLGDNSVEVRWDDNDATDLIFVWKTGDDYESDFRNYGYVSWSVEEGKNKMTLYGVAPGQSYWVQTLNSGSGFTTPYEYKASRVSNFDEWKTPPKIAVLELKERDKNGKVSKPKYFLCSDLEDEDSYTTFVIRCRITWPRLKEPRTYLWQIVAAAPDGYRYVLDAAVLEMPRGGYYFEYEFPMNDFFQTLLAQRGEVPVGKYTFSLYWDGMHACSSDFSVR